MVKPTFLVTGATGKTGGAVVDALLAKGLPVRAVVRSRDARSEALDRKGAETVVADMYNADQLLAAMRGTQRAYYLPPFEPHMIHSAVAFSVAAREANLEAVVQMSQYLSHRDHPTALTRQTWLIDKMFAALPGIAHTIVNPGMFADNFLRVLDFAALLGIYPILSGAGEAAPVSNEDIARVVVAAMLAPERHAGMSYRPTGPRLLSGRDMARIIAGVVGHSVRAVDLPFWMFRKVARQQAVEAYQISCYRHYMEEMKRGTFALNGGVTNVVEDLTGTPAESFETTARRYAAMPFAHQTIANRLTAIAKFAAVPFIPGYDLDRVDRHLALPAPAQPSLSIDDAQWRQDHNVQRAEHSASWHTKAPRMPRDPVAA